MTDVDEAGKVTLSQPQPQVGRTYGRWLPATPTRASRTRSGSGRGARTLTALDGHREGHRSTSRPPDAADEDRCTCVATVTYTDKFGAGRDGLDGVRESGRGEDPCQRGAFLLRSRHPTLVDGVQATRAVDEGKKNANVGKPLSAKDADGDVLLYSLADKTNTTMMLICTLKRHQGQHRS